MGSKARYKDANVKRDEDVRRGQVIRVRHESLKELAGRMRNFTNRADGYAEPESPEAVEFGTAMERYRQLHDRPFPTWQEALGVAKCLGWRKVVPNDGQLD